MDKFINLRVHQLGAAVAAARAESIIAEITQRFDVTRTVAGQALRDAIRDYTSPVTITQQIKLDRIAGRRP